MRLMELKGQPRIIVVYGGGFQPFHTGHMSSYSQAKEAFPDADFYVAASNDTKTRPIPFDAKKFLAQQAGVVDDFVQVRQPINPQEIMQKYDATRDILVLVRSERDPMSYTKKDGSPGYYQPFVSVEDCVPFDQHGYIFVTKKHTFKVNGQEIYSGSQVREMYAAADAGEQESIIAQLYPDSNQLDKIKQIFDQYLSQQGVAEGVDIGREWMSDTELDQYVPGQLQQEWRELLGYDRNGNPSALWANLTGGYEPDVNDPQDRANMVKVANKWFALKKIPNVNFYNVKDADDDDELEWLVQIGPQGVAENYHSDLMKQTYAKFFKPAPPKTVLAVKKFLNDIIVSLGTAQDDDYDEEEPEEINWEQDLSEVRQAYNKLNTGTPNWFDLADAIFSYDTEFRESMIEWAEEALGNKLVDLLWNEVWEAKHQISRSDGSYNVDLGQRGVAEANINQQVSLWHPETQTYRGAGNKIPTSDYVGDNDITKHRRRVNKFKHSEILPNLNYNVSLGGNDDSIEKVEQNINREKIKSLIKDQFHLLNSREKEIFYHKFWHDMTTADIAQQMSLSTDMVKRTADSALKKLRRSPDVQKLIPYLSAMEGRDITEGGILSFMTQPKLKAKKNTPISTMRKEFEKDKSEPVDIPKRNKEKDATLVRRVSASEEKNLSEFTPAGSNDHEPDEEEILRKLAAQWWLGTEQQMIKAERTLAAMGWEIGQDESGEDDAGVFVVRAGDVNGNSYIAFNHSDLELNESQGDSLKSNALSALIAVKQQIQQDRMAELEKWEQDFKNNVVSKFKSRWPDRTQPSTSAPVAQPSEKHSELKAKLSQLNQAIEKQAMLDKLVQKLDSKGLLSPTIQAGVDTSLLVRDGARDNYVSLNQKLDKALDFVNTRLMTHKAAYAKPKSANMSENMDHSKDDQAVPELKSAMLAKKEKLQNASDDEVYDMIDTLMTRIAKSHGISGQKLHDMWVDKYEEIPDTWIMDENFADGRHPGRKGLAKRSGVDTKASVSDLRKTARNSSGEKARMAHWLANMKAGRAKKSK